MYQCSLSRTAVLAAAPEVRVALCVCAKNQGGEILWIIYQIQESHT